MQPIPLVAPSSIGPLVAYRRQIDKGMRLPNPPADRSAPLPLVYAGRLFADVARAVGDAGVGLRIGEASRFDDVPLGSHVSRSLTIGAALVGAARASGRYCGGQQLWVTQRGDHVWLHRRHANVLREGRRQANDFALGMLIDLLRRGAGSRWRPTELHLEGPPPAHAEELAALAQGPTRFGAPAESIVFPSGVLALRLGQAPESLAPPAPPLPDADFADSVRLTVRYLLGIGDLNLHNVAEAASTSTRSLQRRLASCGLGFAMLVDEARFQTATRMLRDPANRVIDVAVALGYTDAANFTRAFRRWAGISPLAFRRGAPEQLDEGVS